MRSPFGALRSLDARTRFERSVLHGFGSDLRMAARRLLATPAFTIFAVISLAIGVGVTTSVYSVVARVFWKAPGIREPGSVVQSRP